MNYENYVTTLYDRITQLSKVNQSFASSRTHQNDHTARKHNGPMQLMKTETEKPRLVL